MSGALDLGHRLRGFRQVDGHPHHLGAGFGQLDALLRGGRGIRRVGHRHRLHDDGRAAAHLDVADADAHGAVKTSDGWHDAYCTKRGLASLGTSV